MTCYKNDHPAGKMTKWPCFIFNKSVIMQVDDTEQYYCPIMKGREGIMEPRDFKAVDEILEQYNQHNLEEAEDFIAASPRMRSVLDEIMSVSKYDCNVLITGDTGVGKEKVANIIQKNSRRNHDP